MNPELSQAFLQLQSKLHAQVFSLREVPETLWHYTTAEGVLGIVRDARLFLTNSSFLNDREELERARDILKISLTGETAPDERGEQLRGHLISQLGPRETDDAYISNTFLTCFSAAADSLVQWRGYGKGEGGFALGFSFRNLFDAKNAQDSSGKSWLLPCLYSEVQHQSLSTQLAKDLLTLPLSTSSDIESDATSLLTRLSWVGACVKHPAFIDEAEWRLAYFADNDDVKDLEFGSSETLKPRLTYDFGGATSLGLILKSIVVGPQRHQVLAARAVRLLLYKMGLGHVSVECSKLPFRSV